MADYYCAICEGTEFEDFREREAEVCTNCRSKSRDRAMILVLRSCGLFDGPPRTVLHLAPDRGLGKLLARRFGVNYDVRDFNPARYKKDFPDIRAFDLCSDVSLEKKRFDCILHNHVLEHIPCDPLHTLAALDGLLNAGGVHVFTVPIRGSVTDEGIALELTAEERSNRFGQADHLRLFGAADFPVALCSQRGQERATFPLRERYSDADLIRYRVPPANFRRVTSGTVFFFRKP